ncbi:hypothetical protein K2X96_02930 [Patescibacteria group bacterium]|nr:hypothetical protein [Patescibacteria group bacterium]
MYTALRFLIILGLIFWLFVMYEKANPNLPLPSFSVDDATRSEKCAQYAKTTDAGTSMDYRDRIKQFLAGCW